VKAETLAFLKAHLTARPDLIVVDPPRAGLGAETTSLLAEVGAPSIVYVSCDPATLARDLRALIDAGYELSSVTLADLFPQTFHLESVVELRRS
jgi:23S rRNA (uracil1939-C5)-methyltransferase